MNSSKARELRKKQRKLKTNSRGKKSIRGVSHVRGACRGDGGIVRGQRRPGDDRREVKFASIS